MYAADVGVGFKVFIYNTDASTSSSTGALIVNGGIYTANDNYFAGDLVNVGDLTVREVQITAGAIEHTSAGASDADAPTFTFRRSMGTAASRTDLTEGGVLGQLAFKGWYSTWKTLAYIQVKVTSTGAMFQFYTASTSSSTPTNRMTIRRNGIVCD